MAVTVDEIQQIRFPQAPRGSRGYHSVEVDAFLTRVVDALSDGGTLPPEQVHRASFGRAPLGRRGYDRAAVDSFLRRVESTLAARVASARTYIAPALEDTHDRQPLWRRFRRG